MAKRKRMIRKDDILFRRSLLRFTILFFITLGLGIASNLLLNGRVTEEWLIDRLAIDDEDFELSGASFRFKQGAMPIIGIGVKRLQWDPKSCLARHGVAQDVTVALNPWRLLVGTLRVGWISVDHLQVEWGQNCEPGTVATDSTDVANEQKTQARQTERSAVETSRPLKFPFPWQKTWQDIAKLPVSYLLIDSFEVRYNPSTRPPVKVQGHLSAALKETTSLDIRVESIDKMGWGSELGVVTATAEFSGTELSVELISKIREGRLAIDAKVSNQPEYPTDVKLQLKKLPVSMLVPKKSNWPDINYLWLECGVQLQGSFANIETQAMQVGECHADGPYGQVRIDQVDASIKSLSSLKVEIVDLQLDSIIKEKRSFFLSGLMSRFGKLNQSITYDHGHFDIEGKILDSEFIFSKSNRRDIQKAQSIPFRVEGSAQRWSAEVSGVDLVDGEFAGEFQIRGENEFRDVSAQINVHKIQFNKKIYDLMLKAEPAPLKVYAKLLWSEGDIKAWEGVVATPSLKSENYELRQVKVKGGLSEEGLALVKLTAQQGEVETDSEVVEWLMPTTLGGAFPSGDKPRFKELSMQFQFLPKGDLKWSRGYVRLDSGWQLSSEGSYQRGGETQAWLQWDRPKQEHLRWDFKGKFFSGQWEPNSPWLKNWLQDNPEFLKANPSIRGGGS